MWKNDSLHKLAHFARHFTKANFLSSANTSGGDQVDGSPLLANSMVFYSKTHMRRFWMHLIKYVFVCVSFSSSFLFSFRSVFVVVFGFVFVLSPFSLCFRRRRRFHARRCCRLAFVCVCVTISCCVFVCVFVFFFVFASLSSLTSVSPSSWFRLRSRFVFVVVFVFAFSSWFCLCL